MWGKSLEREICGKNKNICAFDPKDSIASIKLFFFSKERKYNIKTKNIGKTLYS